MRTTIEIASIGIIYISKKRLKIPLPKQSIKLTKSTPHRRVKIRIGIFSNTIFFGGGRGWGWMQKQSLSGLPKTMRIEFWC